MAKPIKVWSGTEWVDVAIYSPDLSDFAPLASPTFTGTVTLPSTTSIGNVSSTELGYLDGVTSAIQTQLNGKQASDADLTAIAGLTGTSGLLKKTAANTWVLDTNTYLTGNQSITLTGDVSGSGTTSISVTVADDSHNHIISNVDGLQDALDAKLNSSSYTASDVLTKIKTVDGAASGLDADLLDGQHGSYYLDWTNTTNKPDPTITLGGDASGSLTLTDLSGGTLTVTIADDSHNHIISNIDGLQTALDAKAPLASPSFTGTVTATTFSGSLSGNASTATQVTRTVTGTSSAELVRGNMADNDQFRILVGGTASNAGYVEIATADDGSEPIYVRQYTGVFSSLVRTATLLDGSGNTSFPGTVTANTFSGSGASLTSIPQSAVTNLISNLSAKAPLASPALTGTPTAPTAAAGTNTTQIATTAFVQNTISILDGGSP